ncbi:MAG: CotH kinase family protein [Moraxellaceae bacterium]|nr:CotH kinase family protein [Moraxellaceae bacterium]
MSTITTLKPLVLAIMLASLAACGGGGDDAPSPQVTPTPTPTPTPVLDTQEAAAIKDDVAVYAVEKNQVLKATVTTTDTSTWTFADVNNDADDSDANVPEIDAHFVIDGFADDGKAKNATLRLRGHSTRLADQKSYRIKLAKDAGLWRGEQTLQFNKHPYDLIRVRNKLAFDLFRDIPHIPSLRTQFVQMQITNFDKSGKQYATNDYGLFTHVEKMGKEYLVNRKLPTDGNIYKAEDFEFFLNDNLTLDDKGAALNKDNFEKTLGLEADNKNHQTLIAMLTALNDDSKSFDTVFGQYFDKSNYLTWLATSILMGNRDTINQNFALYQPKDSNKFYFLPWDYDGAFGFEGQPDQKKAGELYAPWQLSVANWWSVPLHKRFLQDPKHLTELKQAIDEVYSQHLTEAKIKAKLDGYKPLVQPLISTTPDKTFLPVVDNVGFLQEWQSEYTRIAKVPKQNYDHFLASLESPMPFYQAAEILPDGMLRLGWDVATDLQGDAVNYTVQWSTSPDFKTVLGQQNLTATEIMMPKLPNGVYYLKSLLKIAKEYTTSF